ncbi:Tannase/feruloyl esterase [Diplogelasinospora grovesii]|uniref:Carboxylic ester hydrolase n=1 Tax=Diplogelasinospora grovesii TaxID=303347 RepID=A0AAN6S5C0_9PEZI|nr:Tannase/feruloyl esterase [Diplogelasinospora grovesii]
MPQLVCSSEAMAITTGAASSCAAAHIPTPTLYGADILHVTANLVQNYSATVSEEYNYNHPSSVVTDVDFCNITITYTHPGENDTINVQAWLPLEWNGRLQAVGGGGYVAGLFYLSYVAMEGAIGEGYATVTTDAGLGTSYAPDPWALVSPGNVNLYNLQNLASVSLGDEAVIAKDLIQGFYGQPPKYSYWSGCSQGGRQGMMLAQRYPDAYNGIAAAAPAFNWGQFIPACSWAQVTMDMMNSFPDACELDAITAAAVSECDALDGVADGLVSDPDACSFDPFTMVGKVINCTQTGINMTVSKAAAAIANATWAGPRNAEGGFLWYGPYPQARLTGATENVETTSDLGYAMTSCRNGTCVGVPTGLGEDWLEFFVAKNSSWTYKDITSVAEYADLFHASVQQWDSIIGTADPNLAAFQAAGGKMITYHGLADGLIPTKGTTDYYNRAVKITPDLNDFWRYFQVPGLGHCSGGNGGQPTATFQALVDWVENGVVPESLPISFNSTEGVLNNRILCPYPKKATLKSKGADPTQASSFVCK